MGSETFPFPAQPGLMKLEFDLNLTFLPLLSLLSWDISTRNRFKTCGMKLVKACRGSTKTFPFNSVVHLFVYKQNIWFSNSNLITFACNTNGWFLFYLYSTWNSETFSNFWLFLKLNLRSPFSGMFLSVYENETLFFFTLGFAANVYVCVCMCDSGVWVSV